MLLFNPFLTPFYFLAGLVCAGAAVFLFILFGWSLFHKDEGLIYERSANLWPSIIITFVSLFAACLSAAGFARCLYYFIN